MRKKHSKYNAVRVTACKRCWQAKCKCDAGKITFDSLREYRRGLFLKKLEKDGKITCLQRQKRLMLIPGMVLTKHHEWIFAPYWTKKDAFHALKEHQPALFSPGLTYRTDFSYIAKGNVIYEDVKGFVTPRFKKVQKLMKAIGFHLEVIR